MSWAEAVAFAKDIWWFLSVPIAALGFVAMYYLRGQFPTKAEFNEQNKAINNSVGALSDKIVANEARAAQSERAMSDRIALLEGDVKQLPGRSEMDDLADRIGRVEVQVAASVETIKGVDKTTSKIDHTLGMILDHMLDAAKEK